MTSTTYFVASLIQLSLCCIIYSNHSYICLVRQTYVSCSYHYYCFINAKTVHMMMQIVMVNVFACFKLSTTSITLCIEDDSCPWITGFKT